MKNPTFNHMHTLPQVSWSEARAWMFNYDGPMWYFMGDHHSWIPFSTTQCEYLEEARQQGKAYTVLWVCEATSKCDPGGQHHLQSKIVSFVENAFYNIGARRKRQIMRLTRDQVVGTPIYQPLVQTHVGRA